MSIYIDVKYLNLLSNRLLLYNKKENIFGIFDVQSVVIHKRNQQKQEDIFIEKKMIFSINVIIVEWEELFQIF